MTRAPYGQLRNKKETSRDERSLTWAKQNSHLSGLAIILTELAPEPTGVGLVAGLHRASPSTSRDKSVRTLIQLWREYTIVCCQLSIRRKAEIVHRWGKTVAFLVGGHVAAALCGRQNSRIAPIGGHAGPQLRVV